MFGFQGGESADTVARKKGYMQDAQQRWGFMTNFDLSTIFSSGISEPQAKSAFRLGCEASSSDTAWGASASETYMAATLQCAHER